MQQGKLSNVQGCQKQLFFPDPEQSGWIAKAVLHLVKSHQRLDMSAGLSDVGLIKKVHACESQWEENYQWHSGGDTHTAARYRGVLMKQ